MSTNSNNNAPTPSNIAPTPTPLPTYIGGYNIGGASINGGGGMTINLPYPIQWISVPVGITEEPAPAAPEKKKDSDGCNCKKCKEFYPQAEPNQDDGTLICWACRHGY